MTKKILLTAAAAKGLALLVTALVLIGAGCTPVQDPVPAPEPPTHAAPQPPAGKRAAATKAEDSIFVIDGEPVTLNGGIAEVKEAPDSASVVTTKIFGKPVAADLDGDGDLDAAVFLTREGGGSGTFFYVAASINENGEYRGTDAILLGDRIAPQTLEVHDGVIVANYADRKPGEPMSAKPSVGVSKYFKLQAGAIVGVEKP